MLFLLVAADMVMRNSSAGLTMKEYEEQLKKLTAENFNLKLRIYFVEERLSKVKGISDKEELVKKIIELQVCRAKCLRGLVSFDVFRDVTPLRIRNIWFETKTPFGDPPLGKHSVYSFTLTSSFCCRWRARRNPKNWKANKN